MKKVLKIFGIIVLIGAFAGTLFFLYNKSKKKPDVFETKNPFVSDVIKKTVATGSVVPRFEVDIKPQVSGIIDELFVEAGDRVEKNQVVARIKIIPDMVNLNSAETRLNRAKITFEDAKIDYERQQKLFDKEVISYEEFKNAKVAYDSAGRTTAAENNLELIKNGVTKKAETTTNTLVRSTTSGMVLDVPVKVGNSVIQSNTFNDGTTIATVAT
jgi:HlyD family secretion protein